MLQRYKLYALALSEIRLFGSGSVSVGDDFTLVYAGRPGDGSLGGVAWLLSPGTSEAWRRAGCCAHHSPTGRILRITLALHGNEGVWHLFSVYGPTFQATQLDKTRFWRELGRSWNHIPSRDIAYILGDFNSRVGSRQQPGYPHEVLGLHCVGPPQWQW